MGWLEPAASRKLKPTALTHMWVEAVGLFFCVCWRCTRTSGTRLLGVCGGLSPDRRCAPLSGVMDKLAPEGQ